jgi:hypothetical protein
MPERLSDEQVASHLQVAEATLSGTMMRVQRSFIVTVLHELKELRAEKKIRDDWDNTKTMGGGAVVPSAPDTGGEK